jgi:hypothetical protein
MNMRKLNFWKTSVAQLAGSDYPGTANTAPVTPDTLPARDDINNVISLPLGTPLDTPTGLDAPLIDKPVSPAATQPRGLLNVPLLNAFFTDNHFGLGRHNGANYRTQEALELGKRTLIARFQNALAELGEQKQAKADRLYDKLLETEGFCDTTTSRLRQACTNLEREMTLLRAQEDLANECKGWVLAALNQYQIGFGKGLREAVEFELLTD